MDNVYTYDEVIKYSTEYFNGDDLAAKVFADKYALQNNEGMYVEKTPDDMHIRLAKEFYRIEKIKYGDDAYSENFIYELFKNFKYIVPQGSPMFGIGNDYQTVSLSNCFVVESPVDSYAGIMKSDEQLAQISKRRGGVGLDISNIRPNGSVVNNAAKTSTGITSFMERFSNTIREVGQNGRRGALMITLSVQHPDVYDFIKIKNDNTKVTGANISVKLTEEFMEAVKNNDKFRLRFPINAKEGEAEIEKYVDAKDLFDKIVHNAWLRAEPGVLYFDKMQKYNAIDCYADEGFETISTNPCITGETLVLTADGRGSVKMIDLVNENKDVPVYSLNTQTNQIEIQIMRNPRLTGYNKKILKVNFDDGNFVRVTENHKILLNDGNFVEAKDLKYGDSVKILTREYFPIQSYFDKDAKTKDYVWLRNNTNITTLSEHRMIYEFHNGKIPRHHVIHHIDYDCENNNISNLQCMSKKDHDALHAKDMIGDKNPMRRAKTEWSQEKWQTYSKNMSNAVKGKLNGRYNSHITNEKLYDFLKLETEKKGTRLSTEEAIALITKKFRIKTISKFRLKEYGVNTMKQLLEKITNELGMVVPNVDLRLLTTINNMTKQGYQPVLRENRVFVNKTCEKCNKEFYVEHNQREQSYCSMQCVSDYIASSDDIQKNRLKMLRMYHSENFVELKKKQLDVYTKLKLELDRIPYLKEWMNRCKELGISSRLNGSHNSFKNYEELKKEAEYYNHRVVSVEEDGYENVYNGTVDKNHNFYIGGFETVLNEKRKSIFINNLNCGEIGLSKQDSCRLMCLNLYSYVQNPFTKDATLDYKLLSDHAYTLQRLMDDMVDLEIEKVQQIINKISDVDKEDMLIKNRELELWSNVKEVAIKGRRTGLGVTAEGDMLAALNVGYASEKGIDIANEVHKTITLSSYRSSNDMAKRLGTFPVWKWEKEKESEFLLFLKLHDEELYNNIKKYGRRNIANLTIAPTGSVSILTQTTSGIEPLFTDKPYRRRKKVNPTDKNVRVDFVDQSGDSWQEFEVYHPKLKIWMEITGETDITKSPYYGYTANEISWVNSVKMQGNIQRWIDHSISRTVNLPEDVTVEEVNKIYISAYEYGCKGMTVYRDNCRTGVLITNDKKEEKKVLKTDAIKRPKELDGYAHIVKADNIEYYVVIGFIDDKNVYEIFTGINQNEYYSDEQHMQVVEKFIPKNNISGKILKENRGEYYFIYNDKKYKLTNLHSDANADALCRVISTALRHGADISFVVHQLEKTKTGDLYSFSKILARILKKYIPDGVKVTGEKCPQCESTSMFRQEGCISCKNCGYSKC